MAWIVLASSLVLAVWSTHEDVVGLYHDWFDSRRVVEEYWGASTAERVLILRELDHFDERVAIHALSSRDTLLREAGQQYAVREGASRKGANSPVTLDTDGDGQVDFSATLSIHRGGFTASVRSRGESYDLFA